MSRDRETLLRLDLTSFVDARVVNAPDTDDPYERGVFIPLDINGLKETSTGRVTCDAKIFKTTVKSDPRFTHFIRLIVSDKVTDRLELLGRTPPIIGNLYHNIIKSFHFAHEDNRLKIKNLNG